MDLASATSIAAITAPLTKMVLDTFLRPKLEQLKEKWKSQELCIDETFENQFKDYLNEIYAKNAVLNTVAFKRNKVLLNNVYVPLSLFSKGGQEVMRVDEYNEKLFKHNNKILIVDTAGMGKSTISKKLLISCIEKNKGIPILIELRRLSKIKGIIDEILEQLNPINESFNKQFILDLIKKGDFIFFLDGFDEISLLERSKVTSEIQSFISKANKNKFILTSRPEEVLTSFGDFSKYHIRPLETEEAFNLLRKYDNHGSLCEVLISKIKEKDNYNNIKEYLNTPLLVSLLYTAFEHKQRIPFKKHIFYRQVFDALFESHDLSKGDSFEREKHSGLGVDDFHQVLRIFGFLCLKEGSKIEFTKDELLKIIQDSISYCNNLDVEPSDFVKDLLVTVPIFIKDGVYFKWSHKSLQEYFAALFIYHDFKEKQEKTLKHICFHSENNRYLNVIDLYQSMDPISFDQIVTVNFLEDYFYYLDKTYSNFSGKEKFIRQQYTFTHEIYIIKFNLGSKSSRNYPKKLFSTLRKEIKNKYSKLVINLPSKIDEEKVSFVKVPYSPNKYYTLLNFYFHKEYDFATEIRQEQVLEEQLEKEIDIDLEYGRVYQVTDRKNAFLNKDDNFKKTNDLIRLFVGGRKYNNIDRDKASIKLEELKKFRKLKNKDDLLDF